MSRDIQIVKCGTAHYNIHIYIYINILIIDIVVHIVVDCFLIVETIQIRMYRSNLLE